MTTAVLELPDSTLYDSDLVYLANKLKIPHFRHVKMRDELEELRPFHGEECGIVNLNIHTQRGSHWICYYKFGNLRFYFDSYAQAPPIELIRYLKTPKELNENAPVIHRNAVIVQHFFSNECGSLCLYVLKLLSNGESFSNILTSLLERFETPINTPLILKV